MQPIQPAKLEVTRQINNHFIHKVEVMDGIRGNE